jgi:hypothetical protein
MGLICRFWVFSYWVLRESKSLLMAIPVTVGNQLHGSPTRSRRLHQTDGVLTQRERRLLVNSELTKVKVCFGASASMNQRYSAAPNRHSPEVKS